MAGRFAAAQAVVVHRRHIVVNQRINELTFVADAYLKSLELHGLMDLMQAQTAFRLI